MASSQSKADEVRPGTPQSQPKAQAFSTLTDYEYYEPAPLPPTQHVTRYQNITTSSEKSPTVVSTASPQTSTPSAIEAGTSTGVGTGSDEKESIRKGGARGFGGGFAGARFAEIDSPDPQLSDGRGNEEKIAYRQSQLTSSTAEQEGNRYSDSIPTASERYPETRGTIFGAPRKWICIWVGLVLLGVLALALGLGLGLGLKHKIPNTLNQPPVNASDTLIGGALDSTYYSKSGTFNGTGIAIASANNGNNANIFVFYQKYTGEIEQLYLGDDGQYSYVTTVTTAARNATPLAAVAYLDPSYIATIHLFYIDDNLLIRQRTTSNTTQSQVNIWRDGPLNALNLKANDGEELIGMQACYWGNYYGSSRNINNQTVSSSNPSTGMMMFYAKSATAFDMYEWTTGSDAWNYSSTFDNMNTNAGVACQTWLTNTTAYIAMVNSQNALNILWRDIDTNKTSTAAHPINKWTNTSISIPNVHPSTSLGYTDFLAYQSSDETIRGVDIKWAAENTSIASISGSPNTLNEWSMTSDQWRGIPGTHLAITALNTTSGGRTLNIFYQSFAANDGGTDITIGYRDSSSVGGFSYGAVAVNGTQ